MSTGRSPLSLTLLIAIAVASAACASAPSQRPVKMGDVDTGVDSLAYVRKQLEGTWDLVSLTAVQGTGAITLKAAGRLTYDEFGNMSIRGRIEEASPVPAGALLDYEGRAVIDPARKQLRLVGVVAQGGATEPADVSFDKLRLFAFEGDVLKLSTIDAEGKVIATATWRRAQ